MSTIGGQVNFLAWLTSIQNSFLDAIVAVLDFMGEETFYLLVAPILYWGISKKIGYQLSAIMMVSLYVNSLLKFYTAIKRPIGIEGIHSIRVETVADTPLYPYDSFPSGHAQGSFTLWGYLAYIAGKPLFWVVAFIVAFLISFSRLYAGLHWPTDVIGGALIGLLITLIGIWITPHIERLQRPLQWGLAVGAPLLLFLLSPSAEAVKTAGFLMGSSVAYLAEGSTVRMNINTALWKKINAYVIGIAGAFILNSVLKSILPVAFLSDFIRYAVMGLWIFLLAPWVFVKARLYPTDSIDIPRHTSIPN